MVLLSAPYLVYICVFGISVSCLVLFVDFGSGGENVEVVETKEFIGDPSLGTGTTYLYKVCV